MNPPANSAPLVSVIMAARNVEPFIGSAIQSLLDQSFSDFEIVVRDDGSSDRTRDIVAVMRDPRIVLLDARDHVGVTRARIEAVKSARGSLIAVADADDLSLSGRLEKEAAFLREHPDVALVGAAYDEIDEQGRVIETHHSPLTNEELQEGLLIRNRLCHGSSMYRREAYDRVGGYDASFEQAEDYDLYLRIAEIGKLAALQETLYQWRCRASGLTGTANKVQVECVQKARENAWRRRLRKTRMADQPTLLAWLSAAVTCRRPGAVLAFWARAVLRRPWSLAPHRLLVGRLVKAAIRLVR
jgi:glycosyltransferase involved in cell wall biosynthesis